MSFERLYFTSDLENDIEVISEKPCEVRLRMKLGKLLIG